MQELTLSQSEARRLTDEVKADAQRLWAKLLNLYEGGAHIVLGYSSWADYCQQEFKMGKSRSYQLLNAAQILETTLTQSTRVESLQVTSQVPESERLARELVPLLRNPQAIDEAWNEAVEAAGGGVPTVATVREIVARKLPSIPTEKKPLHDLEDIEESVLREQSPTRWSEDELARRERVEAGITVVANLRGARDKYLISWAESNGLLVRVDRGGKWGNPYETPTDGDRDTVCDHYILHFALKPSLLNEIHTLKGKVLACWCYPERCHGDYLAEWANKTGPEQKPLHLATRAIGLADNFSKFVETAKPQEVWQGLKDYERSAFFANLRVIGDWIDSVEQIKETVPMA